MSWQSVQRMKLKCCYTPGLGPNGWRDERCGLGGPVPGMWRSRGLGSVGRSAEDRSWTAPRFVELLARQRLRCLRASGLVPHRLQRLLRLQGWVLVDLPLHVQSRLR